MNTQIDNEFTFENLSLVIDVSDVQRILGIGRRQAYELVKSGQFHVVKTGKRFKISKEVFIGWLNGTPLEEGVSNVWLSK
ncbi:helix-turn-helix domain-containing protein [Paenibacillus sp. GCM10012307]|uniref:Helix-turn-helix domain-containing protein n=1 Tax=Paenibacillus roseus TaxID=2798579 RepID=A0A934MPX2_9BACL|nr:helix-turn-helix domain-containing protein [Paenibacillus roseus]MBJ6361313.1 helix-turn-helix domain-containing protein [Paenibacillus roseus]